MELCVIDDLEILYLILFQKHILYLSFIVCQRERTWPGIVRYWAETWLIVLKNACASVPQRPVDSMAIGMRTGCGSSFAISLS